MHTLVVHTGAIGDFILFCPALAKLAEAGPVTLLGSPDRHRLAVEAGLATATWSLEAVDFHTVYSTPSDILRAFLADFERIVVWWEDADGAITRQLRQCGPLEVVCHPGLPPADWRAHVSAYYAHRLGFDPETLPPLNPLAAALSKPTVATPLPDLPPNCVVLHPGSGGRHKCWPMARFHALADRLQKAGYPVRWSRGPSEAAWALPDDAEILPNMALESLFRVLAQAHCYIGNDSGVSHLAAAAGCPTLALFGPTDPRRWRPRGATVAIAQGTGNSWPTVDAAWAQLAGLGVV